MRKLRKYCMNMKKKDSPRLSFFIKLLNLAYTELLTRL